MWPYALLLKSETLRTEPHGSIRYSLVWKLVFFPNGGARGSDHVECSLSRPEWGPPQRLGTSAGLPVQLVPPQTGAA